MPSPQMEFLDQRDVPRASDALLTPHKPGQSGAETTHLQNETSLAPLCPGLYRGLQRWID